MTEKFRKITFQGNKYILTSEPHGAITTIEEYKKGIIGYAHLFMDGTIKRFGKVIGTKKDITFGKMVEIDVSDMDIGKAYSNLFSVWRGY